MIGVILTVLMILAAGQLFSSVCKELREKESKKPPAPPEKS